MRSGLSLLVLALGLLTSVSCASRPAPSPEPAPIPTPVPVPPIEVPPPPLVRAEPDPRPTPPRPLSDTTFTIGHSVLSRPIDARVLGDGPDVVLLLSTIHGNEAVGTPLIERLGDPLRANPALLAGRTVILVPNANPDGRRNDVRHNIRGVDLNRNFPSKNFRGRRTGGAYPLSEPESRALHALIKQRRPARVVSLHQPLSLIDHDGPALALARVMAATCRLPVKKLGGRPGSMGSWVGLDLGIPIVTVEFPRAADLVSEQELWRRYGPMLLAAVTYDAGKRTRN